MKKIGRIREESQEAPGSVGGSGVQVGGSGSPLRMAWVVSDREHVSVCLKETDGICLAAPYQSITRKRKFCG